MQRQTTAFISLLILGSLMACRSRHKEEDLPQAEVAEICDWKKIEGKGKTKGFAVTRDGMRMTITKDTIAPDGQKIGHETHDYQIGIDCKVREVHAETEANNDKLVSDFLGGTTVFSRGEKKVYTDTVYGDMWLRQYSNLEDVDALIPNWNTKSGKDLPVTYMASDETTARYVPVWASQGLWKKDGDNYYLVGGRVFLKNPSKNPTKDDVFTALRFGDKMVVATRGVLFPVSEKSWTSFLLFTGGREKTWQRDAEADRTALALNTSDKFKHSRARKHDIASILARRSVESPNLPTVKSSFEPTTAPKLDLNH